MVGRVETARINDDAFTISQEVRDTMPTSTKTEKLDKAREHLEKALAEFERLGMKLWEEKCKAALEGL